MLRFLTAGESHGQALVVIVEGVPAGLPLGADDLAPDLARRQLGYGRGRRMAIEQDRAEILSGVRRGETLGSPIALADPQSRLDELAAHDERRGRARRALPRRAARGRHAAAARPRGSVRRPEVRPRGPARHPRARQRARDRRARRRRRRRARAPARASASRSRATSSRSAAPRSPIRSPSRFDQARALAVDDDVRCVDAAVARGHARRRSTRRRRPATPSAARSRSSRTACPPGLGSHVQWDRKLDGRLAQALMSIPAIKAVGIGRGRCGRPPARARRSTTRSCRPAAPRPARCPASRARPTTPAASKAA